MTHLTMWLDSLSICRRDTSRRVVDGTPSFSICSSPSHAHTLCGLLRKLKGQSLRTSSRVFFSATSRPVFFSRALYTLPYVPSPIFSSFSY